MKLRSPELPAALEADWPQIRDNYAKKIGERRGRSTGVTIVNEVIGVSEKLGKYYRHPDKNRKLLIGDQDAFQNYVRKIRKAYGLGPACASSVLI